jgi:integrase
VPLEWRMFYGFLHREGTRRSEAGALTWSDIDLDRAVVVLDDNKTNDPRAWALSPGVAEALCAWRELRARNGEDVGDDARVFVDEEGEPISGRMADQYREHLRAAGITRPVLFEQTKSRQRVRLHDTRATFVTVSLANGKSEAWVQDRTGHKSSTMIAKYRRAARMAAEVGMGPFVRMDVAVGLAGYVGEADAGAVLH